MSEPEAAPEARRWLRSASEDLHMVRMALGEDPPVVGPACFHSRQAAEKALKAALVLEGIEVPYVHDLRRLRNLLPDGWRDLGRADDRVPGRSSGARGQAGKPRALLAAAVGSRLSLPGLPVRCGPARCGDRGANGQ